MMVDASEHPKNIQKYALEMVILGFFGSFEGLCWWHTGKKKTQGLKPMAKVTELVGRILFVQGLLKVRRVSPTWFYLLFSEGTPIYQFDWAHHH